MDFDSNIETAPLVVNHLKIVGHFTDATPNYDVSVTDSASTVHSVTGLMLWDDIAPSPGASVERVEFSFGGPAVNFVVDNISLVPEPSSLVLAAIGLLSWGLVMRRRRR